MRYMMNTLSVVVAIAFVASTAWGNPALLPKHPGYPMGKAVDPVTGTPLANDPGQVNASGEKAIQQSASFDDAHVSQKLTNENDQRVLEKPGAGLLPKVQGPNIKIEPPVNEATKVQANPQ